MAGRTVEEAAKPFLRHAHQLSGGGNARVAAAQDHGIREEPAKGRRVLRTGHPAEHQANVIGKGPGKPVREHVL